MAPEAILSHLHRADGSATYTHNGYCIIGAVNGPIEVLRRDEMPEEATVEVNVRPAVGVGSPKERQLETLLHNTLRSIILTRSIPRTLVQITLQVRTLPEEEISTGVSPSLTLLPHLLHTSLLVLLSASIPLSTTLTAVLIALPSANTATASTQLLSPTAQELLRAKPIRSAHVFAFSGEGKLLLNESDGRFSYEEWDEAAEAAQEVCCKEDGGVGLGEGMEVDGREGQNLDDWLRSVVRTKVGHEQRWKSTK
ncbi:exosome non-catalytic core subunit rrp46 [Paraconiothyrium brasiliense]|uniref:Exosome non-catalytic core subunit rrp46 n=1 Tax=Paraconiothyrium brasiliense TaxID=300254 RepID=A0ABR3RPU0_9PLEO